jgi:plasmid maintenance system antidote protein VapI
MSLPNKRERKVRPTHPGVMLREDFLPEYGLTVSGFARSIRVSRQTVNDLLRERRAALTVIRQQPRILVECPACS